MDSTYLKTETAGPALIATPLTEKVAERESNVIQNEVLAAAPAHQWKVAMDAGQIQLLASVGLGMLVSINRECKAKGGKFVVFNISPDLMSVLYVTKLEKVVAIANDRAAALKLLS